MKILYGVVGEGMGHAVRSRVVLDHLVAEGHEIEIMASGRAVDFLHKHFEGVNRIHGLHMIYEENRVRGTAGSPHPPRERGASHLRTSVPCPASE